MAHLDEGVRSLERFIGLLALATGEVERTARDLANADRDLSALERAAAEQGTGFNERLQDLGAAIESGADQATEALEDLKAMAEAPEPIDDARDRLGEAVGEITQRARAAGEDADESHALVEEGFANLGRTTDELARQLTRADEEMDSRTAELAEAVAAFQGRTEAAWDAPALAASEAAAAVEGLEPSLQGLVSEGISSLDAEAVEIESACSSLAGELTALYASLVESVRAEQQALSASNATAAGQATHLMDEAWELRIDRPAEAVEREALALLAGGLARLTASLTETAPLLEALPPLTGDLATCAGIVAQIDQLLQAMAG